ncbi:MAG: ribonuclease Z [Bacteroidia bacterium]|nr:ribonuclease Z [Bacteroidia bacterium]
MKAELHVLGSSSALPTKDRHPSAQVLTIGYEKILIDCGEGTQTQLVRYGIKLSAINYICISHLHGDHYFGLIGLISTMSLNGRKLPLHIIAPSPLKEIIELQLKYGHMANSFELIYHDTNPDKQEFILSNDSFSLTSFPLKHRIQCNGFLITESKNERPLNASACEKAGIPIAFYRSIKLGNDFETSDGKKISNALLTFDPEPAKTFAYCSDTIFDGEIIPYIKNADLLYHETTYLHELADKAAERYHSTAKQAGEIAKQANVKKLVIGHFSSRYDNLDPLLEEARIEFSESHLGIEGSAFML